MIWQDTRYWASEEDFRNAVGQAYPAGQGTAPSFRTAERGRLEGLVMAGMVGDPDPYVATMNALNLGGWRLTLSFCDRLPRSSAAQAVRIFRTRAIRRPPG